jgi:hypothetical protein
VDELQIRKMAKTAIKDLAEDFQGGNHAFFFRNESDIQCRLFRRLTQKGIPIDLVHAEYGVYWDEKTKGNCRGAIDIVVWRPEKKDDAIALWGKTHREFSQRMPDILAVAIEIDYFYGPAGEKRWRFETVKELMNNDDVKKLAKVAGRGADAYLLIFWDDDVKDKEDLSASYWKINEALERLNKKYCIKSIIAPRDYETPIIRIGF